jgi:TRAP-type C4-dicarboxylate transport system permease small subunit
MLEIVQRIWIAFGAVVWWLSRMLAYVSALALFSTMLILLRESIGRYYFDSPTTFSYPLMRVVLLLIVYFGLAYTATTDGHVSSDVLYDRLPLRGQEAINVLTNLSAIFLGYLLAVYAFQGAQRSAEIDTEIPNLFGFPLAAAQSFIVIGAGALVLVCFTKLPHHIGNMVRGDRAPFPPPSWRGKHDFEPEADLSELGV